MPKQLPWKLRDEELLQNTSGAVSTYHLLVVIHRVHQSGIGINAVAIITNNSQVQRVEHVFANCSFLRCSYRESGYKMMRDSVLSFVWKITCLSHDSCS